ncbi:MAG: type II toxin-antitoxin system VapC family toxin [Methylovulum sp.]|nr:type II toxin-antitoxin system VapC family toxin [Methylovulum sp.]
MASSVYIETSIISYLTSRTSRSLIGAARQQLTQAWWDVRLNYDLYISEVVSRECAAGDLDAAKKRLDAIEGLGLLRVSAEAIEISKALVARNIVPAKAAEDALHISIATVHAMDFLLTWNCKHIANPEIQKRIALYLEEQGLFLPFICTPDELLGADDE